MISTATCIDFWSATEFACDKHECRIEHTPLVQILNQPRKRHIQIGQLRADASIVKSMRIPSAVRHRDASSTRFNQSSCDKKPRARRRSQNGSPRFHSVELLRRVVFLL